MAELAILRDDADDVIQRPALTPFSLFSSYLVFNEALFGVALRHRSIFQLLDTVKSKKIEQRPVGIERFPVIRHNPHSQDGLIHGVPEILFVLSQNLFRFFYFGDVKDDPEDSSDCSIRSPIRHIGIEAIKHFALACLDVGFGTYRFTVHSLLHEGSDLLKYFLSEHLGNRMTKHLISLHPVKIFKLVIDELVTKVPVYPRNAAGKTVNDRGELLLAHVQLFFHSFAAGDVACNTNNAGNFSIPLEGRSADLTNLYGSVLCNKLVDRRRNDFTCNDSLEMINRLLQKRRLQD